MLRFRKSRAAQKTVYDAGWRHVLRIAADEKEPGIIVVSARERETDPWVRVGLGTGDIESVVILLDRARGDAQRALDAHRRAAPK